MNKLILIGIIVLLAISTGLVMTSAQEPETAPRTVTVPTKYEVGPPDPTEMLELVNMEREKVGVAPLAYDANVEKSAQLKATDFSERDYYDHIVKGTDRVITSEMNDLLNLSCSSSSENISADEYTSYDAVAGWMSSPPHKKAILSAEYHKTGFGVSQDKDGDYYSVQHFCVAL